MAAGLGQAQARDSGSGGGDGGAGEVGDRGGSGDRVVAESFEAQQARLAEKPTSRRAGRLVSRLPIWKS